MKKQKWEKELDDNENTIGGQIRLICDLIHVRGIEKKDHSRLKKWLIGDLKHFISNLLEKEYLRGYGEASNLYASGEIRAKTIKEVKVIVEKMRWDNNPYLKTDFKRANRIWKIFCSQFNKKIDEIMGEVNKNK